MKIAFTLNVQCEAPDGTDAWDLARWYVTGGGMTIGRKDAREMKEHLVRVSANGKNIPYKPARRVK